MWAAILGILSKGLAVINKLLPSREWKGGQATAEAKATKEARDVLEKQLEIAAKPPAHRSELLRRMFKRKRHD